jgi:aminoglycoside phosphotransferase (APT) family kinase protein
MPTSAAVPDGARAAASRQPRRDLDGDARLLADIAARALGGSGRLVLERARSGVSTPVYRVRRGDETLYLRLAETREAGLAPEALVHRLLRERGVRVPEVVYFEPFDEALQRSVMMTTEIAGRPLAESDPRTDVAAILVAAGRDLAVVNSLPVAGFGWIRREGRAAVRLAGELPTYRQFALEDLEQRLDLLRQGWLTSEETEAICQVVADNDAWFDADRSHLAHGDFDVSHIYHDDGEYTGMIDFGEIRGTDRLYDLAHFALHDGERLSPGLLPHLLAGYMEVTLLPEDHAQRIALASLLVAVGALARSIGRSPAAYQTHLIGAIWRTLAILHA